jgi:indolepyruvate ferredoxin oxidoreductase
LNLDSTAISLPSSVTGRVRGGAPVYRRPLRRTAANPVGRRFSLKFNLAPPLFAKKDAKGHLVKAEFGAWMWTAFKLLVKLKGLRGGAFDVFGYSAERRMERALIAEYRAMVEGLLPALDATTHATAVELAALPEQIRGFGHVKEGGAKYRARKAELLSGNVKERAA